jgi:predicted lysophospholipase L1 biosynthesis ABC-type transport system permease subunit
VVNFTSVAVYEAGFNQLSVDLPVLRRVRATRFLGLFLGLILNVVTVVLLALAVRAFCSKKLPSVTSWLTLAYSQILLIYALMMTSVETKTFELGVLRMVGMTRRYIVQLLLLQGFAYAIPAWIIGMALAQAASAVLMDLFEQETDIPIEPWLTPDAIWIATVLGLAIPVVSAILPIRTALTSNLHDALDTSRNKNQAVKMSINRTDSTRLSVPFLLLGIGLAAFGFGIYYLMPLALLAQNFFLLLNLFFGLLLGMLFGLTLLSLNLQHPIERILVAGLFWWEKHAITKVSPERTLNYPAVFVLTPSL